MKDHSVQLLLEADELVCGYHGVGLLRPFTFRVLPGQFWGVFGRNGSGKTTLLRTLLGLQPSVSGKLHRVSRVPCGYVPQRESINADVPFRVIDLVAGGALSGWSFLRPLGSDARNRVERAMDDTDLQPLRAQPFSQLSEGQKQRVLLARALAVNPGLLVLDEPTSSMDHQAETEMFDIVARLVRERDLSALVVSHHAELLARHASHVLFADREEKIILSGRKEEVLANPAFGPLYASAFAVSSTGMGRGASGAERGGIGE